VNCVDHGFSLWAEVSDLQPKKLVIVQDKSLWIGARTFLSASQTRACHSPTKMSALQSQGRDVRMAGVEKGLDCGDVYLGNACVDEKLPSLPNTLRDAAQLLYQNNLAQSRQGRPTIAQRFIAGRPVAHFHPADFALGIAGRQQHGERLGHPVFRVTLLLEREDFRTAAVKTGLTGWTG